MLEKTYSNVGLRTLWEASPAAFEKIKTKISQLRQGEMDKFIGIKALENNDYK